MENKKTPMEIVREKIDTQFKAPEFDKTLVSRATVENELAVHEKAYLSGIVNYKTELKFLNDSIDTIEKMDAEDPNAIETATKHMEKSKTNPKYFENLVVDPSCRKALGHLQNIESKMTEVKNALWTVEYHSGKIAEVREYLALFQ